MTWKSHILFAGSLAYALGFSPPEVACIAALSTVPDRMESLGPLRILRHRGISHDLALWLTLLLLCVFLEVKGIVPRAVFAAGELPVIGEILRPFTGSILTFPPHTLFLGPVFHLLADMLTPGGIGFVGGRIRFPLCRTRASSEYAVTAVLSAWWFLLGRYAPRLEPAVIYIGRAFVLDPEGLPVRVVLAAFPLPVLRFLSLYLHRFTGIRFSPKPSGNETGKTPVPGVLRVTGLSGREVELHPVPDEEGIPVFDLRELKFLWKTGTGEEKADAEPAEEPEEKSPVEPVGESPPVADTPAEESESESESGDGRDSSPEKRLEKILAGYREDFERAGLDSAVKRISEILLTEGRRVSSVAGKDPADAGRPRNQFELLSKVSLLEHSVDTAEKVVEIAKRKLPDSWRAAVPRLVLCALAHDLGKLPSISGDNYTTAGHPLHSAAFLGKLLKGHPWREDMCETVKRHHEKIGEKTPVELEILILADKEAREEEADGLSRAPVAVVEPVISTGPPEVRPIPDNFPLERVLRKIFPVINTVLENGAFVAFSQPDGVVYIQAETVHAAISEVAREVGLTDEFFHSTEKPVKKSCLQSFYNEFRRRGWVPEKLVSEKFYGNFFWVWNPRKQGFTRAFYMPLRAEAFGEPAAGLEKKRQQHPLLSLLRIRGVAPPGSSPPHKNSEKSHQND